MNIVAIVDYGMCNLDSVACAVEECGVKPASPTRHETWNPLTELF
jgi:imidazoleglycerol phosphate synthase glutamine amidotransferase subunit HisH